MDPGTRQALAEKVRGAGMVAQSLEAFDGNAPHEHMAGLVEQWGKAETGLREAYELLLVEAERDRDATATLAKWARIAAWTFTALAALLMGDWKKALGEVKSGTGAGGEIAEDNQAG